MLTRSEVKRLEYDFPMPKKNIQTGKTKVFEEVFIEGGGQVSEKDALEVLRKIQEEYNQNGGWFCEGGMNSGVFLDTDGRWYAYRHHAKYQ